MVRMLRRLTLLAAAALAACVALPAAAQAHGLVGRADLPLPEEAFGAAAAGVLVVSFLALAAGWSRSRLEQWRERPLVPLPAAVDAALGAIGIAVFAIGIYAGLAGSDRTAENLLPTLVYVGVWVGIPFLSLLAGDVFRLLSPWRALGRGVGWLARRLGGESLSEPLAYPERLGRWPAVAGIVAFGICELAWADARTPQTLAILALIYSSVQLVGMATYGVEPWSRNADALGIYFGLFARISPWTRRDGRLVWRRPLAGVVGLDTPPGTVALLVAAIGVTAFDGAREGRLFNDVLPDLQQAFESLGLSIRPALELSYVLGLFATIGVIGLIWAAGVAGMPGRPGRRFAHSLVPIVAAYVVAHYFSLLAYNGQDLWRLAQDPLGNGPASGPVIDYSVVSATAIWYVQVIALVAGHVAALVLAHDRALVVYGDPKKATRSQVAMLVVMVAFTCLGLWLLSAANK
jgi:hypothetical protein